MNKEIQNVTVSFEELDNQMKSDVGYSSEDKNMNVEESEVFRSSRAPPYMSTQMVYELKTKLRCTREEDS